MGFCVQSGRERVDPSRHDLPSLSSSSISSPGQWERGQGGGGLRRRPAVSTNVAGARTVEQRILLQLGKKNVSFDSLRSSERWFLYAITRLLTVSILDAPSISMGHPSGIY